jgi:hypothetical protein
MVLRLELAAFFAAEAQGRGLVVAHDDASV